MAGRRALAIDPGALLTLREDALIEPVSELDDNERGRFEHDAGDFVVSQLRSRAASVLVDRQTAELLLCFREPHSIAEAIVLYSVPRRLDAAQLLTDAMPMLDRFIRQRLLINADDPIDLERAGPSLLAEDRFDDLQVIRHLQIMDDGELFQVRTEEGTVGVLKILRDGVPERAGRLDQEAKALKRLTGGFTPALLRQGEHRGRRYLLMAWCPGVGAQVAAAECRPPGEPVSRHRLLQLCCSIAGAYAELHRQGVLHGDVHPRNLLVDRDSRVQLVDFGAAWILSAESDQGFGRPGVPFYFEPELASSMLEGLGSIAATIAGEQFALGALLYYLVTGVHYYDFSLERREMLRQIAECEPLSFEQRGLDPWPELESVLRRALAKRPEQRFSSTIAFTEALAAISRPPRDASGDSAPTADHRLQEIARQILEQAAFDGPWLADGFPPPTSSLNFGAAGVAYALYRISCLRGAPRLLALADLWARRAAEAIGTDAGFYDGVDLIPERIGQSSPYHCASGIHAVRALVARGRCDLRGQERALDAFMGAAEAEGSALDLTLGGAGSVLSSALLLDTLPNAKAPVATRLLTFGRQAVRALWLELDRRPALAELPGDYLGIAHGWAGFLYATLQWSRASGDEPPAALGERLDQLAEQAVPSGRGLRWTIRGNSRLFGGWCHGGAGFVFLWTLAHRLLGPGKVGSASFFELAEGAGWTALEDPGRQPTLCCGLTGRAYALLHLYKHTGQQNWLVHARQLARHAAAGPAAEATRHHSLYRGDLGLALLAADLEWPQDSVMPWFEEEGW